MREENPDSAPLTVTGGSWASKFPRSAIVIKSFQRRAEAIFFSDLVAITLILFTSIKLHTLPLLCSTFGSNRCQIYRRFCVQQGLINLKKFRGCPTGLEQMFPLRKLLFAVVLTICVCVRCLGSFNVYKARILSSSSVTSFEIQSLLIQHVL